ncbi:MAG: LacI family transcriptional regulator [Rariglobus sp.]|jgi:LacI family transcriptional regulator|nr:LacI family transcriptional regulator [Rariglobus sp.]
MPLSRYPTTREIAAACACSQSTVSNALRNDPRISEETRTRIQQVATDMGWRPNPLAAAFMSHLRSTKAPKYQANLAFVVSNPESARVEDLPPHQRDSFIGARERAGQLGYVLEPVWVREPGINSDNFARMLQHRGIHGLIIPGLISPTNLFTTFEWGSFSSVALSSGLAGSPLHRVAFNYNRAVPMALHRLFEMGYRRIGVIVSTAYDKKVNHGWLYPLYYEQKQPWGRQWIKSCIFSGTDASDRRRVRAWIEKERPDVILGEYLAWHVIHEMGWTIPSDVAFATFDWSDEHLEVGGIYQGHEIIGAMAVDLLTSQLTQNERGLPLIPKLLQIEGKWRDGESVPQRGEPDLVENSRAS